MLTVWSYVLDTDEVTVVLNDGRRYTAKLLGADPRLEIAVLKIDARGPRHFDLDEAADVAAGTRVLAFSNLFGVATGDEAASVQKGAVAAKTSLAARRGAYETPYDGPVYVLDAMTNNPGAAGGALVNLQGELLGLLGKELRNSLNNIWLNYAMPIDQLRETVVGHRGRQVHAPAGRRCGQEAARTRCGWSCWASCWCPTCWSARRRSSTKCGPTRRPAARASSPTT